ncbi:MAG: putative transporter transrane protein [Frankiales bacterium]|nr:putative transporter transrane protein [Frankiales bacterium]
MSAVPVPAHLPAASAGTHGVTFPRVVGAEWIKFRTLRSSWLVLLAAFGGVILIAVLIGYNTAKNWSTLAPEDSAPSSVLQGYYLGQLLIGVLGVLFVSGEYSTGMIRSTLAAVPRRTPVLLAKALVFGAVALVVMTAASMLAFLVAQPFLSHYGHGSALGDPTVLRVIFGTGLYLALVGLLGGALGWIVRSTPGGISVLVGLLLVVPVLFEVLPGSWSKAVGEYLPGAAGSGFVSSLPAAHTLTPATGLVVLVVWVIGLLGAGAVLLRRRDA